MKWKLLEYLGLYRGWIGDIRGLYRGPRFLGLELKFDEIKGLCLGVTGILAEGCMFLFCISCAKGLVLRVWHSSCQ